MSNSESPPQREKLSWPDYGLAAREMGRKVVDSGYRPDLILSIARGGLCFAASLGYALDIKNIFVLNVEYYTGVEERLEVPVMLPPYLELVDLDSARMLIADDVADTGHTLEMVRDYCAGKVGEVRTVVLYEKPRSVVRCDYVWRRTSKWIEFPWSDEPPLKMDDASVLSSARPARPGEPTAPEVTAPEGEPDPSGEFHPPSGGA